jgi:hypothetical protein
VERHAAPLSARRAPTASRRGAGGAGAELEQGLSERIRRAEVSAAEAQQIESAILALTVADDASGASACASGPRPSSRPPLPPTRARQAFERRQVEIVSAWSALPPAARDRAALERELEVLRQAKLRPRHGSR